MNEERERQQARQKEERETQNERENSTRGREDKEKASQTQQTQTFIRGCSGRVLGKTNQHFKDIHKYSNIHFKHIHKTLAYKHFQHKYINRQGIQVALNLISYLTAAAKNGIKINKNGRGN